MDYLNEIDTTDIDLLIRDIQLMKDGYEILYITDAGDVIDYAFPYGIKFNLMHNRSMSADEIGDNLIAFEYILEKQPVIMAEYKNELVLNRNGIKLKGDENLKKDLFTATINNYDRDDFHKALERSATFLLGTALVQGSMVEVFDDVFQNKLLFNRVEMDDQQDERTINQWFSNIEKSNWSIATFKSWVQNKMQSEAAKRAKRKGEQVPDEDFTIGAKELQEFRSTLTDLIALDRLCRINQKIQDEKDINGKYIFLYYSGAKKSRQIFALPEVQERLPNINGHQRYDLLRMPKHTFLLFLIQDQNLDKMLDFLRELRFVVDRKASVSSNLVQFADQGFRDIIEEINKRRREFLEHDQISIQIKKHRKFEAKVRTKMEELQGIDDRARYAKVYQDLLDGAQLAMGKISILQSDLSYLLQGKLLDMVKLITEDRSFHITKGMDLIKGNYHHLPILLFYSHKSGEIITSHYEVYLKIIDHITIPPKLKGEKLQEFTASIKKLYVDAEREKNRQDDFHEILYKGFLYLIIESAKNVTDDALRRADLFYEILKQSRSQRDQLGPDYLYMLAWLSRRIKEFTESRRFCELGMKEYPEDPRFYHGKCLYLYNVTHIENSLEPASRPDLDNIIHHAEMAIRLYRDALNSKDDIRKDFDKYIQGSVSALQNLLIYCISLYYLKAMEDHGTLENHSIPNYPLQEVLRDQLLVEIKDFEDMDKGWAEYCHTEAVFELVEGLHYNSAEKLDHAKKEIDLSLDQEPDNALYLLTRDKIIAAIKKLV